MTTVDREWFTSQMIRYEVLAQGSGFPLDRSVLHPCDDREGGAIIDPHYAIMDLWAAQKVRSDRPIVHVDIGSRVDGFITHLLALDNVWQEVIHVDIRKPQFSWPGFTYRLDDARCLLTFDDYSVSSLSCLHCSEHVGLGRFSDPIDAEGMLKVMRSLARILYPGGHLYFAVPVGRQRVCFNAHRIASPSWVRDTFTGLGLTLESFSAVDDAGKFHEVASISDYETANYACGMFVFTRPEEIGL